jgi:hypothetical protein
LRSVPAETCFQTSVALRVRSLHLARDLLHARNRAGDLDRAEVGHAVRRFTREQHGAVVDRLHLDARALHAGIAGELGLDRLADLVVARGDVFAVLHGHDLEEVAHLLDPVQAFRGLFGGLLVGFGSDGAVQCDDAAHGVDVDVGPVGADVGKHGELRLRGQPGIRRSVVAERRRGHGQRERRAADQAGDGRGSAFSCEHGALRVAHSFDDHASISRSA